MKFYRCNVCGNMVGLIRSGGGELVCCEQSMEELIPGSVDASSEKHVPDVTVEGAVVKVQIGSAVHPMLPEHHIEWVYIHTKQGGQRKKLNPGVEPKVEFLLSDGDKVLEVYEYCNLHGLWMNEM